MELLPHLKLHILSLLSSSDTYTRTIVLKSLSGWIKGIGGILSSFLDALLDKMLPMEENRVEEILELLGKTMESRIIIPKLGKYLKSLQKE